MNIEKRDLDKELQEVLTLACKHSALVDVSAPTPEQSGHSAIPHFYWVSTEPSGKEDNHANT